MDDNLDLTASENLLLHSGFPNPGSSRLGSPLSLDLNHLLIKRPSSSFIFRVSGHAYADQSIYDGDLIIVDRALNARPTDLLISWQDNSFRLIRQRQLDPEASDWGVVKAVIRSLR